MSEQQPREPLSAELREAINEKAAVAAAIGTVWSGFYAYDVARLLAEVDWLRAELAAAREAREIAREWERDNPLAPGAEISNAQALDAFHAMRRVCKRLLPDEPPSGGPA